MAHPGAGGERSSGLARRLSRLSALSKRTGIALLVASLPAAVVTFSVGALGQSTSLVGWVGEALARPVLRPGGVAWAFHVAVLVGLCGVWLTGVALVAEGLLNPE